MKQSDGTLAVRHYKIGDFAHGGIVFWVDVTGVNDLVCDTADVRGVFAWHNGVDKVTNANADGIKAGVMNTLLITAQQTIDDPASPAVPLVNQILEAASSKISQSSRPLEFEPSGLFE